MRCLPFAGAELALPGILKTWLHIDSRHQDFEPTIECLAHAIARNDSRFGIRPRARWIV